MSSSIFNLACGDFTLCLLLIGYYHLRILKSIRMELQNTTLAAQEKIVWSGCFYNFFPR